MREYRLPKGWSNFSTNASWMANTESAADKRKREKYGNNLIRNTHRVSGEELAKKNDLAFAQKQKKDASYEQAKKEGKLLSQKQKDAIKEQKRTERIAKRKGNK